MYVRLTRHYISRWRERTGKNHHSVTYIRRRLAAAIHQGPLLGQGDGTFIVQVGGKGRYAVVAVENTGWVGITLFSVRPPLRDERPGPGPGPGQKEGGEASCQSG